MKYITKLKLAASHQLCESEDRSTEYTLQYLQDTCEVDLDCVVSYITLGQDEHHRLFDEVNDFIALFDRLQ